MSEPKIHLNNGILIGAGIFLILLGFFGWFSVSTIYGTFSRQFKEAGVDPSPSRNYAFRDLNRLISIYATFVVAGIVSMLLGVLSEKNRVVSDFMNKRGPHARLVNGLWGFGGALAIISLSDLLYYLLASDSEGSFLYLTGDYLSLYSFIVLGAIGIFSIILGIVIRLHK